jgi:hypothetical protein
MEQWKTYGRQGYLHLGKVLTDTQLKAMQDRIDAIMLGEADVDYSRMTMQLDSDTGRYEDSKPMTPGHKGKTLGYRKIQELEFDPIFLSFMQRPLFEHICRRIYGDVPIACFRAMFMNKPSHKGTFLPWHQDRWRSLDRDPQVTIWLALDPATVENGCVQVIPGSHNIGLINPEHPSGFLAPEQAKEWCQDQDRVFVTLKAGEAVILHNYLLHGSDVNRSDQSRRAFSICYMDGRTQMTDGSPMPYTRIFGAGALSPEKLTPRLSAAAVG